MIASALGAATTNADSPLALAGHQESAGGGALNWDDPLTGFSVASLLDPSERLSLGDESIVLQARTSFIPGPFPELRVDDALPAFWAQPSVWGHFIKGPGAYSGFNRELCSRDWLGRLATDQRAYALDPGLRRFSAPDRVPFPFVGIISVLPAPDGLALAWTAVAGHTYPIEQSSSALGPFGQAQVWTSPLSGPARLTVIPAGKASFYRVADLTH
ncbi:MAG: hypothetical protein HYR88_11890 [Verrucomicrobia bacterium]|nr:hypothetical protein [Verrucomicrobiota bacterium]